MLYHEQSDDYRPLMWMRGHPVYANTLVVIGHIVAFVISAICIHTLGYDTVFNSLALSSYHVWTGQVWRLFTYVAYDPGFFQPRASYWFLINIALLYFFGREVEQFIGRRAYLLTYAAIIVIPAVLLSLFGLVAGPQVYLDCGDAIFGVFVAFATIYPGAMPSMWLTLSARVLMWIFLGISTVIDFALNNYTAIFMLWACSAVGYFAMRYLGAGPGSNWLTNWLEERRAQRQIKQRQFKVVQDRQATDSIDAILEKISKHGVGSLDARERAALEKARTSLLKRDQR
jgi:membrane associated rhomboid family serine protease